MLPVFLGITTIGSVRPYFRKHVLDTLEPTDYFFINSLFITLFVIIYFVYTFVFNNGVIKRTYENCCKLTPTQIGALLFLSLFTVVSSFLFFNVEKYFNTPLINNISLKAFSMVMLVLVSVFIFEEAYHIGHILGIGLTIAGILVLLLNPMKSKSP